MKVINVNHYNFTVSDLDRSISFYKEFLGMTLLDCSERDPEFSIRATGYSNISLIIAYLVKDDFRLELIEYKHSKTRITRSGDEATYGHICLNVTGLLEFYLDNKDKIKFVSEPLKIPAGPNKDKFMVYIHDPDGNKIELIDDNKK